MPSRIFVDAYSGVRLSPHQGQFPSNCPHYTYRHMHLGEAATWEARQMDVKLRKWSTPGQRIESAALVGREPALPLCYLLEQSYEILDLRHSGV